MNKVWMITGAGRGLGRAFAEEAVKNGDMVIATVRKINDADPLMKNENVLPGTSACSISLGSTGGFQFLNSCISIHLI